MARGVRSSHVAVAQAAYFLPTGLWATAGLRSFQALTGPKRELWLVQAAGGLVTAVGAGLALAGWRGRVPTELRVIAVGSALTLATIDVVYVARRRISPVYLGDALAEALLLAGWALAEDAAADTGPRQAAAAARGAGSDRPSSWPRSSGGSGRLK